MFIPCIVVFRPQAAMGSYQRALICNGLVSALRLHQRLPQFQFNREYLGLLLLEDSCHNLLYSLIFANSYPITCILYLLSSSEIEYSGLLVHIKIPYKGLCVSSVVQSKTQYLQISNIRDTSIKHLISSQSTPMVTGCMDICLVW